MAKKEKNFIAQENLPSNCFSIDFLTVTVHDVLPALLLKLFCDVVSNSDLEVENFTYNEVGATRGYNRSYRFLDQKYITISWHEERTVQGVCFNLTGQGCSYLTKDDIVNFVSRLSKLNYRYSISRLDIAFDDFHREIPVDMMVQKAQEYAKGDYDRPPICTKISAESIQFHTVFYNNIEGKNLTFGSRFSAGRFRLYDKRAEQKIDNLEYWYRLELELRKEKSLAFMNLLLKGESIDSLFIQALFMIARYIEDNNVNPAQCKTSPFFEDFTLLLANYTLSCIFWE